MSKKQSDKDDEAQPLLPLDERFRRAEQFELELYPDEEEEKEKRILRRLKRILWK